MFSKYLLQTVLLFLQSDEIWITKYDWYCLGNVTQKYFHTHTLLIFFDRNDIHEPNLVLFQHQKPVYVYTNQYLISWENGLNVDVDVVLVKYTFGLLPFFPVLRFTPIQIRKMLVMSSYTYGNRPDILWRLHQVINLVALFPYNRTSSIMRTIFPYTRNLSPGIPEIIDLGYCEDVLNRNVDLYPQKVPEHFNGVPLIVTTDFFEGILTPTKFMLNYFEFGGPQFKLINSIVQKLGATLLQEELEDDFFIYDFEHRAMLYSEAHFDGCGFTPTYYQGDFVFAAPTPGPNLFSSLYSGFGTLTWLLAFTAVTLMALLTAAVCQIPEKIANNYSVADVLRTAFGNAVVGRPQYFISFKTIVIIFELYSLHIIWFYQINALKNLFHGSFEKPIRTLQDAADRNLTLYAAEEAFNLYTRLDNLTYWPESWSNIFPEDKMKLFHDTPLWEDREDALREVTENKTAIFYDLKHDVIELFIGLYANESYLSRNYQFMDVPYDSRGYMFCMSKHHPLLPVVSRYVQFVVEAGIFNHWVKSSIFIDKISEKNVQNPLTMLQMPPAFYVVCILLALASFLFLCEVTFFRITTFTTRSRELNTSLKVRRKHLNELITVYADAELIAKRRVHYNLTSNIKNIYKGNN